MRVLRYLRSPPEPTRSPHYLGANERPMNAPREGLMRRVSCLMALRPAQHRAAWMLMAIRRASSRVSSLAAARRAGLLLEIERRQAPAVGVADDEAGGGKYGH
jgi:hypothetical protein